MPLYDSYVNIQWAIRVTAPNEEIAKEQVKQITLSLLNDIRYEDISDESIDIDITLSNAN